MERRERSRSRARASLPQPWQDLLSEILDLGDADLTVSVSRDQDRALVVLVHRGCRLQLEAPRDASRDLIDIVIMEHLRNRGLAVVPLRLLNCHHHPGLWMTIGVCRVAPEVKTENPGVESVLEQGDKWRSSVGFRLTAGRSTCW